ncbi:hypothetical protein PYCC9005_005784 [Savitreella phatthalungensis]
MESVKEESRPQENPSDNPNEDSGASASMSVAGNTTRSTQAAQPARVHVHPGDFSPGPVSSTGLADRRRALSASIRVYLTLGYDCVDGHQIDDILNKLWPYVESTSGEYRDLAAYGKTRAREYIATSIAAFRYAIELVETMLPPTNNAVLAIRDMYNAGSIDLQDIYPYATPLIDFPASCVKSTVFNDYYRLIFSAFGKHMLAVIRRELPNTNGTQSDRSTTVFKELRTFAAAKGFALPTINDVAFFPAVDQESSESAEVRRRLASTQRVIALVDDPSFQPGLFESAVTPEAPSNDDARNNLPPVSELLRQSARRFGRP